MLLVATDIEAAMVAPAFREGGEFVVAGKRIVVGELTPLNADPHASGPGCRVVLAISGIDKVNAAHMLTCVLQAMKPRPRLVLQMGIAGALPAVGEFAGAQIGDVVIATRESYSDTGASGPFGWQSAKELGWPLALLEGEETGGVFPIDGRLVAAALEVVANAAADEESSALAAIRPEQHPRVFGGPCITASQVTGLTVDAGILAARWEAMAESMEGAAAAHICALYGVPFLEVRGISNLVGDRDHAHWQVRRAVAAASWATRAIVGALPGLPLPRRAPGAGHEED